MIDSIEFRRHCSTVHKFIDEAVQEALSVKYQDGKSADVHSFLDALIKVTRDPRVLRGQLLNLMLAGRDTTACCLTWTLYVIVCLKVCAGLLTNLPTVDFSHNIRMFVQSSDRRSALFLVQAKTRLCQTGTC